MRKLFPLVVLIATVIVVTVAFLPNKHVKNNQSTLEPTATPAIVENPSDSLALVMVPDGMQLYSDSDLGVRLAYPENFEFEKNGNYSVMFSPKENPVGNPVPTFFYVSVVPARQLEAEGTIYNYRYEDYEKLNKSSINTIITLTENRQLDQWYKYTRLDDREIGGVTAKQYVNTKPWEFPNGTEELRYLIEKDGIRYLLGAYYQQSNPRLTKQTIAQMLDSFSILSGQEILE